MSGKNEKQDEENIIQKITDYDEKPLDIFFRAENKTIMAVVLVSIAVFALFIMFLDASITGMVARSIQNSRMDNLFFVMTVFGLVIFLGSMLFYYLSTRNEG